MGFKRNIAKKSLTEAENQAILINLLEYFLPDIRYSSNLAAYMAACCIEELKLKNWHERAINAPHLEVQPERKVQGFLEMGRSRG